MTKTKTSGFTLVELLIALLLFSILVSIAVPSMQTFMRSNRLTSTTNDMVTALNVARSEAVRRSSTIKLCISNAAQDDCDSGTGNWENGWIMFIDDNGDDSVDSGEKVLRVTGSTGGGTTIRTAQYGYVIAFGGDGSASDVGSFRVCGNNANAGAARGINISLTGNVSAARDTNSDGTVNIYTDASGTWGEISCP